MERAKLLEAINKAFESKGARKFTQSVELVMNFKEVDFGKNKVNIEVQLPKGRGKEPKIAVFADGQVALDAKKAGFDVIAGDEIPRLAADRPRLKAMARDYEFLAQPNLMMLVGKHLGQFLGTRNRLPKPLMGVTLEAAAARAKRTVRLKSKGRNLPVLHCLVGRETMSADDIAANIEAVLEAVKGKVGEHSIKSVFVKLTMGKPVKVI